MSGTTATVVIAAIKEVAGPTFFALLVIAVSFPARADAGSAGRPHVQAAGVHQNPGHADRGGDGDYAGSGSAPAADARASASTFIPGVVCRIANALLIGKVRSEEDHAISRWMMRVYEPRGSQDPALEVGGDRRRALLSCCSRFRCSCNLARSSCRRWMKARSSTCRPPCRAFRSSQAQMPAAEHRSNPRALPGSGSRAGQGGASADLD